MLVFYAHVTRVLTLTSRAVQQQCRGSTGDSCIELSSFCKLNVSDMSAIKDAIVADTI